MSSNYTPRLNQVLSCAQKSAQSSGHSYVGTEHLLLALVQSLPSRENIKKHGFTDQFMDEVIASVNASLNPPTPEKVREKEIVEKIAASLRELAKLVEQMRGTP